MTDLQHNAIAVLPFENRSADAENAYFCDGLTEEIIHALSKIEELRVISRNSSFRFKGSTSSTREIGQQLKVNTLVEGSVRFQGETLRVSAQLVEVAHDRPFWSQTWDRNKSDIFQIQDEVSIAIADRLREEIGHLEIDDHLAEKPTKSLKAYDHYLRGKFLANKWNARDVNLAIEEYQKAIEHDPDMIQGHLGLADAYSFLAVAAFAPREAAMAKSMEATEKARSIDPENSVLNCILGNAAFFGRADFAKARAFFLKSLASDPSNSETHRFLAFIYSLSGELKKSYDHIFYAKSVDPLNPETRFFEANHYYRAGDYLKSEEIINSLLDENPNNLPVVYLSLYLKLKTGRVQEAEEQIKKMPEAFFTPDERLGLLTLIDILKGIENSEYFLELIDRAKDPSAHHAHSYLFLAYSNIDQFDKAFEVLNHLFEHQSSVLLIGFSDPLCDGIKSTERYKEFHSRIYPVAADPKPSSKKSNSVLDEEDARNLLKKLNQFILAESPFLNPSLTLRILAESLEIHPNLLSRLLNDKVGKNFNEFVNHFRIEHFKKAVVDPANSHISILGLAYESGFNSKTVFNTAFKKAEGMTPKAYQKSQMA